MAVSHVVEHASQKSSGIPACSPKGFSSRSPGLSRPSSRADEARLSGAGRFVLGRAEKKAAYVEGKAGGNVPRCSSVPWSILLENVEGSRGKPVPVPTGKFKDPSFKPSTLDTESPTWICEVSSALGSVQTGEGSDALKQWLSRWQQQMQQRTLHARAAPTTSFQLKPARVKGLDAPKQEWCRLSGKAKRAIQQWASGEIGGRHCLMLLEHDAAIDFFIAPLDHKEMSASDVGSGGALCALSGLPLDAPGSREGGWLYREVFQKSPAIVLEEALHAASTEAECGKAVSADQVNLGLRQLAMKAQADGMRSLLSSQEPNGPRCSDEYMRTQVWLELVRRHVADTAKGGQGSNLLLHAKPKARPKRAAEVINQLWDDGQFLRDLEKPDNELESEAGRMSLQQLRRQNQSMETYMMRVVRQRDYLKHVMTLADECASYFVLGLDGPTATTEEIKKAYRALALKEHPDKAGIDNKERFQEIHEAYAAVLRRSKSDVQQKTGRTEPSAALPLHKFTTDAVLYAEQAKDAAEEISLLACRSFELCALAAEARGLQKRAALRELMTITRQGSVRLRSCSTNMRILRVSSCHVADGACQALDEYGQWAASIMSGVGLQERGEVVKTTGLSCGMTADHLDDMAMNDENMVGMLENPDCSIDQASAIRVLSESTARTATVIRCAADKAICIANSVLELGCSLAMLDQERRREKLQQKDTETVVGEAGPSNLPKPSTSAAADVGGGVGQVFSPRAASKRERKEDPSVNSEEEEDEPEEEAEDEEVEDKDGKPKQAKLLVRNLRWLESLNKEVLELQSKLRTSIQQDRGMLKGVEPEHKGGVFDLVGQILHAALAEAAIWSKDSDVSSKEVLERSLAFALALEHTKQVAVPAEVKTQVMKHAALLDVDLLCQIIEGPFQKRLLSIGGRRGVSSLPSGRPRALGPGSQQSWTSLVQSTCTRIIASLREPLSE